METIEDLKRQKAEIDRRIREMQKKGVLCVGRVKIDNKLAVKTGAPVRWTVSVECEMLPETVYNIQHPKVWRSVIMGPTRERVIEEIPALIQNLQAVYDAAKEQ